MKQFLKIALIILAFFMVLIISYVIYLMIPDKKEEARQQEIAQYEHQLKVEAPKPEPTVVATPVEKSLSPICESRIQDLQRLKLEEVIEMHDDGELLIDEECTAEVDEVYGQEYKQELHEICNYFDSTSYILSKIGKGSSDLDQLEFSQMQVACSVGSVIYRKEMNQYLDENLRKIDRLSRYMYLKMVRMLEAKSDLPGFVKSMAAKLPFIERLIKETNRYVFVTFALKAIHEEQATVNDLRFEQSPIRQELIGVANNFGKH